jgi:hypothetical protein
VALVMKGHPEIRKLTIEVHADGVSKAETQHRAEIIRDTLVKKGVDAARLVPVGGGAGGTSVSFLITQKKAPKSGSATPATGPKPSGTPEGGGTSF